MSDSSALSAGELGVVDQAVRLGRLVRAGRRSGSLNDVQWEALRFLGRANRLSRNPAGIAAWLGVTRGLASHTVDALARQGLILRLLDPRDGRGVALEPTQAGHRMAASDPIAAAVSAVDRLPRKAAAEAGTLLAAALAALERASAAPACGSCRGCRHFRPNDARHEAGGPHRCARADAPLNDAETQQLCVLFGAKDSSAA
jgi:MarR family transcriptional repressor of emrRAB